MFNLYFEGVAQLFFQGFLGMTLLAVLYHVVPALTDVEWPSPGLVRFQVWLAALGAVMSAAPLFPGGYFLGAAFASPGFEGSELSARVLLYLGVSTLGKLFVMGAAFIITASFFRQLVRYCVKCGTSSVSRHPATANAPAPSRA